MAHLWVQSAGGWEAQRLGGAEFDLAAFASEGAARDGRVAPVAGFARLVCAGAGGSKCWALVTSALSDVRVNGRAVESGLCVLADRDEIRSGSEIHYFSTETLAAVEAFQGTGRPVYCGRCRQMIVEGSPSVRCPCCGVYYNQSDSLPCWTYSGKCTFCGHPTALDTAGFTWTPGED